MSGSVDRLVVLFDLDLTLLEIPGDREIRARAIDRATGVAGILDLVDDRGRTDRWLIDEIERQALADPVGLWDRYEAEYTRELRDALGKEAPSALPGADALLTELHALDTTIGVSTGNLRANAVTKITHARLATHFEPLVGGFGDEHADRPDIVKMGAAAAGWATGCRLVVVGDTVHDVQGALGAGATPVAVATGHATAQELKMAGASVVLDNLIDTASVLSAIAAGTLAVPRAHEPCTLAR